MGYEELTLRNGFKKRFGFPRQSFGIRQKVGAE